jgi:uncharacterized protein YdcH (DUF465 family)
VEEMATEHNELKDEIKRIKSEVGDAQDLAYDAMKEVRKGRLS